MAKKKAAPALAFRAHHPACQGAIDHLQRLLCLEGRAPSSIRQYCRAVRDLQAYCDADIEDTSPADVLDFLDWRGQSAGPSTLNVAVCALRYYFAHVGMVGHLGDIPTPRKPDQLGELLPVRYQHIVFNLPHEFNDFCRYDSAFCYSLLFRAA